MSKDVPTLDWLLEPQNPGVQIRALRQICGLPCDHPDVLAAKAAAQKWLPAARSLEWRSLNGLPLLYPLIALAECGFDRTDLDLSEAVNRLLAAEFDTACGDMMALRALVMMGYLDDPRVRERLAVMDEKQLPDGGWFCQHRLAKMDHIPRSCYKNMMHALLLAGELAKLGYRPAWVDDLLFYFFKRRVFYRTDNPTQLVTGGRPGWRVIDVFFPLEVMRVGFPYLLEAFAALGAGSDPALAEAWQLLESKKNPQGRVLLEGTLSKSYLPKEPVGKPSRWATLYAMLASQAC